MNAPHRQDSMSAEVEAELQANLERWRQDSTSARASLAEARAAHQQTETQVERLQATVRDLQREAQSRGGLEDLQSRFKEV